ncbi:MAG: GNAT family N-acetyltransferase [Deltaproteobacteria bacterium]|nr:GNAT family N-acetyltransferase [Deltaproteobacteria bacterium]
MRYAIDHERDGERESVVSLIDDASAECARISGAPFVTPSARLEAENDVLVARTEGGIPGACPIHGVVVVRSRPGGESPELAVLYVCPEHRRGGLGDSLLSEAVRLFGSSGMWAVVHSANMEAMDLFGRHGFVQGAPPRPGSRYRVWTRPGA